MILLLMEKLHVEKEAALALYSSGKQIGRVINCAAKVYTPLLMLMHLSLRITLISVICNYSLVEKELVMIAPLQNQQYVQCIAAMQVRK